MDFEEGIFDGEDEVKAKTSKNRVPATAAGESCEGELLETSNPGTSSLSSPSSSFNSEDNCSVIISDDDDGTGSGGQRKSINNTSCSFMTARKSTSFARKHGSESPVAESTESSHSDLDSEDEHGDSSNHVKNTLPISRTSSLSSTSADRSESDSKDSEMEDDLDSSHDVKSTLPVYGARSFPSTSADRSDLSVKDLEGEDESDSDNDVKPSVSVNVTSSFPSCSSTARSDLMDSEMEGDSDLSHDVKNPLPVSDTSSFPSTSTAGSSNLTPKQFYGKRLEESQIFQTNEDRAIKEDKDRSKRFEFLLQKTEIWGHFMKTAYEEALTFPSGEGDTSKTSQGSAKTDSQASTAAATSTKGTGRDVRGKWKKKLIVPSMSNSRDLNNSQDLKNYVTHFDSTPSFIKSGAMRDYQVTGLNWLISLYERGISGILADEMGLGKTLEAISLLGYLKHCRTIDGPHLIIAPKSTLPNWMNEINRWCPSLKAICLIGSKEERPAFIKKSFLPKRWNVCVTSYEMAKIEKATLAKINYHYIVIDEAQKIKNENSLLANVVRRFKSSNRLLLTGTPLQNNLHELWALLNFLLPDVFSSSEDFDSWFNESSCMGNQTLVDRLHAILRPFLLRRIKSDVEKSLPPKVEMRLYVQLSEMQREWYRKVLMNDINVINDKTGRITKRALQNIIMHLRKVCNHPYLFDGAEPKPYTTDSHLVTNCGKMVVLDKLLLKLKAQNSRVLLFSQMTRVLDIIQDYCIWRGFEHCRLDGGTDYDIRQEDIDAFNAPNSDKFIYLLSTRAGGLGINLASADIVIIYDSDWNPQMDLQAMDRAHRIGQTKEVKVFRFVVQDTLEEKIVERAASKLHLDRMVIQQGRLAGASVKVPTAMEMLNVARFGAEKILKSGVNIEISDADIDTILARSKLRSEEFDRRLNGMSEDNLKDLTIEQVEFDWKNPATERDTNFHYFEGKNYRELRDRNRKLRDDGMVGWYGDDWTGEKRRRTDQGTVKSTVSKEKNENHLSLFSDDSAESFGTDDSYAPSPASVGDPSVPTLLKKPNSPLDFQFGSPYVWELYWKELDYYHKKSQDHELKLPEDISQEQILILKAAETDRLQNAVALNTLESREKQMLTYDQGFYSWTKKHFSLFLKAMIGHGCDNLQAISDAVKFKTTEEIVCYTQRFWAKCHELENAEEILKKLKRTEMLVDRRKVQQELLEKKINARKSLGDPIIHYEPERWKGQRFSSEDDNQLLLRICDIGLQTPNVFEILQSTLLRSTENGFSPFLRTRAKEELQTRFNLLMHIIEAETSGTNETSDYGSGSSNSKILPSPELKAVDLNGAEHSIKVQDVARNSQQPEGMKENESSSSQSSYRSTKSNTSKSSKGDVVTPAQKRKRSSEDDSDTESSTPAKSSRT